MIRNLLGRKKLLCWFCIVFLVCRYYIILISSSEHINEFSDIQVSRKSPPVVVYPMGGLGNQLFQYACAYSLAKKRNSDLYICVFQLHFLMKVLLQFPYSNDRRYYSLDQLTIPQDRVITFYIPTREDKPDCGVNYYLNNRKIENVRIGETDVMNGHLPPDKVLIVQDWFESEIFFKEYKEDILRLYNLNIDKRPIQKLLAKITSTESVSVHIRRGDFRKKKDYRALSINYQITAMKMIQKTLNNTHVHFYIFTDDLEFAKSHLHSSEFENLHFVSELQKIDNSLLDFLLMLSCKHNIIANSTFSWWGAYLNKNKKKLVIAPMPKYSAQWINSSYTQNSYKRKLISEFAYPEGWVTIKPEFESG